MKSNSVPACAGAFVLISLASATTALARNWLASEPDTAPVIGSGTSALKDSSIDYGSRVQVRIYRPDGIYEIRDGLYHLSPSGFDDADSERADD